MKPALAPRLIAALVVAGLAAVAAFFYFERPDRIVEGDEPPPDSAFQSGGIAIELVAFSDIEGWRSDDAAEALPALLRSCAVMMERPDEAPANPSEYLGDALAGLSLAGTVADWRRACAGAAETAARRYADQNARKSAARAYFEAHFAPVKLLEKLVPIAGGLAEGAPERLSARGRFTGYFEPFYRASQFRTDEFSAAVYERPFDLVMIDLGRFRPELAGQRIAGSVRDGFLEPYPDHAAINGGAIAGRARVLAFMRPTDLLFLQIQGSGRLNVAGREIRVGYDGANGRNYTPIGKTLINDGALTRETVSMETIKEWLDSADAADARRVRESNESFVFFRVLDALPDGALGPLGAQGVHLTAGRSLAVDPRFTAFGAPVFVSIDGDAERGAKPLRQLMIAQDSGGAIKGPVRGDIFVGSGPEAGEIAGSFNEMGAMVVLTPRAVAERLAAAPRS
jgi:membrane-bound lytic murein transglycosylase A